MFRPLAYTKTFALIAVAGLAVTLVPALCTIFIRGRLRSELENPLIRSVIEVYRPVLSYLMDRPVALVWVLGITFLLGLAPLGNRPIFLATLFLAMVATAILPKRRLTALVAPASLLVVALVADQTMTPLGREFITAGEARAGRRIHRADVGNEIGVISKRDHLVLCRFPEVDMVVGKAGRAETPTDPAPMDMIETMVNFRPRELWPRRKLKTADAKIQARAVCDALVVRSVIAAPNTAAERDALVDQAVASALPLFDAVSREYAYHRNQDMTRGTQGISPTSMNPSEPEEARVVVPWREHIARLDLELITRSAPIFTRLALEQLLERATIIDKSVSEFREAYARVRAANLETALRPHQPAPGGPSSSRDDRQVGVDPARRAQPTLPCNSRLGSRAASAGRFVEIVVTS